MTPQRRKPTAPCKRSNETFATEERILLRRTVECRFCLLRVNVVCVCVFVWKATKLSLCLSLSQFVLQLKEYRQSNKYHGFESKLVVAELPLVS